VVLSRSVGIAGRDPQWKPKYDMSKTVESVSASFLLATTIGLSVLSGYLYWERTEAQKELATWNQRQEEATRLAEEQYKAAQEKINQLARDAGIAQRKYEQQLAAKQAEIDKYLNSPAAKKLDREASPVIKHTIDTLRNER
jgi:hypothetical protein